MKHHLSINIFAFVALPLAMFLSCKKDKKQTERTIANGKVYGHKNIACKISSWVESPIWPTRSIYIMWCWRAAVSGFLQE